MLFCHFSVNVQHSAFLSISLTNMPLALHMPSLFSRQSLASQRMSTHLQWQNGAMSGATSNISFEMFGGFFVWSISISEQSARLSTDRCLRVHFSLSLYSQVLFLHTMSILCLLVYILPQYSTLYSFDKCKILTYNLLKE